MKVLCLALLLFAATAHVRAQDFAPPDLTDEAKLRAAMPRLAAELLAASPARDIVQKVVSVLKQPGEQINYGTGRDVSDESIADAGAPLEIRWSRRSYVDVPVKR